jgi:hypothetical protein
MLNFKTHVPYYINQELLGEMKLEPNKKDEREYVNKSAISIMEFLHKVVDNKMEYIVHSSFKYEINTSAGAEYYSFDPVANDSTKILKIILDIAMKTNDLGDIFDTCTWYFIEDEKLIREFHLYYHFILCKGDNIIDPMFTISDGIPLSFPQTFLLEDTNVVYSNDGEAKTALALICYEKWQRETPQGRIYAKRVAMKKTEGLGQKTKNTTIGFWVTLISLVIVAIFVPTPYNLLIFLGALWLKLTEIVFSSSPHETG